MRNSSSNLALVQVKEMSPWDLAFSQTSDAPHFLLHFPTALLPTLQLPYTQGSCLNEETAHRGNCVFEYTQKTPVNAERSVVC